MNLHNNLKSNTFAPGELNQNFNEEKQILFNQTVKHGNGSSSKDTNLIRSQIISKNENLYQSKKNQFITQ
tara:strand:+ start:1510 stop:1719 length:210 start_codon:yes stop_codon:yes gene_type:complete